jgi:hypothetical protein
LKRAHHNGFTLIELLVVTRSSPFWQLIVASVIERETEAHARVL